MRHVEMDQGEVIQSQVGKNRSKNIEKDVGYQEHQGIDYKRVEPCGQ